jgi:hypothetical protein
MSLLLPNGKQQFTDNNGVPLNGGKVYFYIPNTTTFKNTYQDEAQTILNTNPVVLDSSGRASIWGTGDYRQQVYDSNGNLIWDQTTSTGNGTSGSTIVRSVRNSNTVLGVNDNSTLIEINAVFTQTFSASATLGNGWFVYIRNDTSSAITLQPNGVETIDGASSVSLLPTEERLVVCDGTALYTTIIHLGLASTIKRVTRSSNTVLAYADESSLIDATAAYTQTFSASSSLFNGWFVYVRNSSTGSLVLQPNGVETIDGASSVTMIPGEVRLVVSNGSNLYTIVLQPGLVLNVPRSARASNTALAYSDDSTLIDMTAAYTQTFNASATLYNGWCVYIRNSSASNATLQPNGGETIDGSSSATMLPGEARMVFCDGTALYSIIIHLGVSNSSGTLPPQGRLTLTSNTPVMTADASAQGTVYYAPYIGNSVPVYNGTTYIQQQYTQLSLTLDSNAAHTGYQQSGKLFDLFCALNGSTLVLGTGPAWTSSTARGTGAGTTQLQLLNGIWTNANALTLKYDNTASTLSVPVNQATYVGTMYATANGQTSMQFSPAAAAGGGNPFLGLFNAYNKVRTTSVSQDNTQSWTYGTATWRSADNSTSNRVSFVDGLQQSQIMAQYSVGCKAGASGAGIPQIGIGLDSTSTVTPPVGFTYNQASQTNDNLESTPLVFIPPKLGFHFIQALEYAASATATFLGLSQSDVTTLSMQLNVSLDM